ncbi:MAG TPA: ATP-binding cassette domain-containing protein, partial [Deltaproteobacteria bacterium]|nr:ATP-binding cassette domain-containing protein [Deltaproteobacteria bacterium]
GLADDREKKALELSFGQQKLLSFARLMAAGFDILLLDEPTAGIHPKMIHKIEEILIKLVEEENKTIAIIEHNMSVIASLAYWVNFMTEGEITFSGRTDHVLGDENVRKIYMGIL